MKMLDMKIIFILLISNLAFAKNSFLPASFKVDFLQSFKSSLTGRENKSTGKLEYKFPSRVRFKVEGRQPSLFVSNPSKSWLYSPPFDPSEKGEVVEQSSENLYLPRFFDSLKNGLKNNQLYSVKKMDNFYLLDFSKDFSKKLGMKTTKLYFKDGKASESQLKNIEKIVFTNKDKKDVVLTFSNFSEAVSFSDDHFVFELKKVKGQ